MWTMRKLGWRPPSSPGGWYPTVAVEFLEDSRMPAPTATSVCCAQAKVGNRRTAHADRISANFLKYSPLVSSFKLLGCGLRQTSGARRGRREWSAGRKNFGGQNRLPGPIRDRRCYPGLVWADCVSDRCPYTDDVAGGKVGRIVEDLVVMRFGPYENVTPDVITQTASDIDQEVIGTLVARANVYTIACLLEAVEAGSLPADAGHQVHARLLAELRLVHAIEVKQNRAIGDAKTTIISLARPPGGVEPKSHTLVEDHIGAKVHIQASLFGAGELGSRA